MEKEIKYHPKALAEVFKSARFYDRRVPGLGARFFEELDLAVEQLRSDPLRQRADADGVRSWLVRRFLFRIYYFVEPNRVRILAVAHAKRRPGYWRRRIND
jgi:hypothetical protein